MIGQHYLEDVQAQLKKYKALLAKHAAGAAWKCLSIPRGRSREFEVAKTEKAYRPAADPNS